MMGKGEGQRELSHFDFRPLSSHSDGLAFLGTRENRDKTVTAFMAMDLRAQMSTVVILPTKSVRRYALTEFKRCRQGACGPSGGRRAFHQGSCESVCFRDWNVVQGVDHQDDAASRTDLLGDIHRGAPVP